MKAVVALLAFAACASAGLVPAVYHDHHHHHAAVYAAPIVKHVAPVYAVQPPVVVHKAVYAPAPVVKVVHAAPVVKTVYHGPIAYGAYGLHHHHDLHHHDHHHGHFF